MSPSPSPLTTALPAGTWEIDPSHSTVGFTVRHMMVAKVRGQFREFTADIVTGEDPLQSKVSAVVQMASVDTRDENRDQHLRTNDFFDVENHPTMTFTTSGLTGGDGEYELTGDLTIRGVTKPVTFDLEVGGVSKDPWGNTKAGFSATTTISRKEWGLEYNAVLETGGVMVGDKVTIELDIEAALKA